MNDTGNESTFLCLSMPKKNQGFTLLELLLTLAIAAILLSTAVPSMSSFISSGRVSGAADVIKNQIEWARSEAVKDNENVSVFLTTGSSWCLGLDDNSDGDGACDCSSTSCNVNSQTKVTQSADFKNISITTTISGSNFVIDSRGITDETGNVVVSDGTRSATLNLTRLGQVSICSDNLSSYPACN